MLSALLSSVTAVLVAGTLVAAPSAQAASTLLCSGYANCLRAGYDHHGYEQNQRTSYWNMYGGTNCTNYVAYRLVTTNGMANRRPASGVGNARDWGTTMASITDTTPAVGSVAWWGRTGNHVAYVERVASPTEIIVSESNWGRDFDHRRITKSGSGWPDGFIHFADPDVTPRFTSAPRPTFAGAEKVGSLLTARAGSWSPTATLSYQWVADGTPIRGATASTYRLTAAERGRKVHVVVTGRRAGYPATASTSARTSKPIAAGDFGTTARPTLTGTERVGAQLVASAPTWKPAATLDYQWYADDEIIPGATSSTLPLDADLLGQRIGVVATGSRPGYNTQVLESATVTDPVAPGVFDLAPAPVVAGTSAVGSVLTASTAAWSPTATLAYQWFSDDTPIAGATTARYTVTPDDRGHRLHVVVTGSRTAYTTTQVASQPTDAVAPGQFTTTARPVLSGAAQVGTTLQVRTDAWSPVATFTYQWFADGRPIPGATGTSYRLTSADRGKRIRVGVTGTRDGYVTRTLSSSRTTPPVQAAPVAFRTVHRPVLSGAAQVGTVLRASTPAWSPVATFGYRWYADGRLIAGATGSAYRPVAADRGKRIHVTVTGSRSGYVARTIASTRTTAPVAAAPRR